MRWAILTLVSGPCRHRNTWHFGMPSLVRAHQINRPHCRDLKFDSFNRSGRNVFDANDRTAQSTGLSPRISWACWLSAIVTGSEAEGIYGHYPVPSDRAIFFDEYGSLDSIAAVLNDDCAAVILEPMNYETFAPAPSEFLPGLADMCRKRGALLIIDETRTGLGRSGRLWMTSYYDVQPDILILGKGLGGGLYPVSALLTQRRSTITA